MIKNILVVLFFFFTPFVSNANLCQKIFRNILPKTQLRTIEFFDIPKTNNEAQFKLQGFNPADYGSFDQFQYMIKLGRRIKDSRIDPHQTHIENLARLVNETISYIKKGIQDSKHNVEQKLQKLKKLEQEAFIRVQERNVTYAWWLNFNYKLSKLPGPYQQELITNYPSQNSNDPSIKSPYKKSNSMVDDFLNHFPSIVALPINTNEVGIFTINSALGEDGIFPIQLSNKVIYTDGEKMTPNRIFVHDFLHIFYMSNFQHRLKFHEHLQKELLKLSKEEIQRVQLLYFLIMHETRIDRYFTIESFKDKDVMLDWTVKNAIIDRFQDPGDLGKFIQSSQPHQDKPYNKKNENEYDFYSKHKKIIQFLNLAIQDFTRISSNIIPQIQEKSCHQGCFFDTLKSVYAFESLRRPTAQPDQ